MQPTAQPIDPVKRVTVTLDGKEYPLKFRLSDLSNLAKNHNIDLFVPAEVKGLEAVTRLSLILAAGIAHTGAGITAEQIMEYIELPELPIFALAIAEAQKKVSLESARASEILATMAAAKPARLPSIDEDETIQ